MEIKSEPKFDVIPVTDIDIAFPGDLQTFTLRDGVDEYEQVGARMTMRLAGGELEFNLQHAHWTAVRHRTIRVLAKTDKEQA